MSLSEAQVSGAIGDVAEALIKASNPLAKVGMDGPKMGAELLADRERCEKADAEQEAAKRVQGEKTKAKDAAYRRLWVKGSGFLDMVIAAVEKDSDAAKNFRRIRSRVSRPPADEGTEPAPLPVPVPGRTQ